MTGAVFDEQPVASLIRVARKSSEKNPRDSRTNQLLNYNPHAAQRNAPGQLIPERALRPVGCPAGKERLIEVRGRSHIEDGIQLTREGSCFRVFAYGGAPND